MRNEPRRFDRKDKPLRRLVVPRRVTFGPLQAVKRPVDFDARQHRAGVCQLIFVRQFLRVKHSTPRRIVPPANAHANVTMMCAAPLLAHACFIPCEPEELSSWAW